MQTRVTGLSSIVSSDSGMLSEVLGCLIKCKIRILDPELILEHVVSTLEMGMPILLL